VWDLRPFERLQNDYDLSVLMTGSNLHGLDRLGLRQVRAPAPRDRLTAGRARELIALQWHVLARAPEESA
jgi:hypothetical protein